MGEETREGRGGEGEKRMFVDVRGTAARFG
jgi:hypothetical protein